MAAPFFSAATAVGTFTARAATDAAPPRPVNVNESARIPVAANTGMPVRTITQSISRSMDIVLFF
jgi:hypothetical protein